MSTIAGREAPSHFRGTLQIVRLNWTQYAVAVLVIAGMLALGAMGDLSPSVRVLAYSGAGLAAFWTIGSLVASWWIYDLAQANRCGWLAPHVGRPPTRWVNIHAGFDETTAALRALFPAERHDVLDIYSSKTMTEPSIARARRLYPADEPAVSASPAHLPVDDASCDAVFAIFALHEVREKGQRESLFTEIRRILRPGGRFVLVEHARDLANFLAFGPGFVHFLPTAEWHRLGALARLSVVADVRHTPFVRALIFCREAS